MTKRGYCSLCLTEKSCLLHYYDDMHLLNKKSESLANANMRLNDLYHQLNNLSQKTNSIINLNEYLTNRY